MTNWWESRIEIEIIRLLTATKIRYRFTDNNGEKGEIESIVIKKTPGRKKKVKLALVYNPKSGKRFTREIKSSPKRKTNKKTKECDEDPREDTPSVPEQVSSNHQK